MQTYFKEQKLNRNAGFSLVEVLVCIAILALISVPILAGFRNSAWYTNKAHKTQKVTTYVQETLETIKSTDVEAFVKSIDQAVDQDGNDVGESKRILDGELQSKFELADGTFYANEYFETIICTQKNIEIDSELYDMEITFDPTVYSQKKIEGSPVPSPDASDAGVIDANVYAVTEVNSVNGMLFPVIADEINSYEGTGAYPAAVLYNLRGQLKENQHGVKEMVDELEEIYTNLTKTVQICIDETGSESKFESDSSKYIQNQLKVTCNLLYESTCNGVKLKQIYNVYSGNFELMGKLDNDGSVEEWEKGGNIYIFARAYQDQYFVGKTPTANKIEIINNYHGSAELDIYLVRGYYAVGENKWGLQFDEIKIGEKNYMKIPQMTPCSGEMAVEKLHLHTNVKGMITDRTLTSANFEETIGMGKPVMRCYQVTIRMTEKSSGKEVAYMETTKEIRE